MIYTRSERQAKRLIDDAIVYQQTVYFFSTVHQVLIACTWLVFRLFIAR
jgi:hypothetical protein